MGILDRLLQPNIAKLQLKGNVKGLANALRHRAPGIRERAAAALGSFPGDAARDALASALADRASNVRSRAAVSLATMGDPKTLPVLLAYKREYCAKCGNALQTARDVRPLSRGFDFADAVLNAAQVLGTSGRECSCGATICVGCLPMGGGGLLCPLCGASV